VGQAIGATATEKRSNGELRYTLPTIVVPATGEVISDSAKIAAYLEAKYPEKALFTEGKMGEQLAYEGQLFPILGQVGCPSNY
jgi:glutathione S-transferase